MIDPANLPSQAGRPETLNARQSGLGVGLGFGWCLGIFEGPRLLTIQNSDDARHYTGLPVLLAVPELLTPQEARAIAAPSQVVTCRRCGGNDREYSDAGTGAQAHARF